MGDYQGWSEGFGGSDRQPLRLLQSRIERATDPGHLLLRRLPHAEFYESDELDDKELSDRLRGALAAISAEQAEVCVMRYVDQLTYDEIAERMNSNRKSSIIMNRTFGREVSAAVNSSTYWSALNKKNAIKVCCSPS